MRLYRKRGRGPGMLTAAEIGAYVYCKEAWRLQEGLGLEPGNRSGLTAGTRHHSRKAVAERIAGGAIGFGRMLIIVALALLVLWLLVWR
jgi:hypothetical protein